MDTHITTAPDLGALGTPLGMPVGLPEEEHAPASMSKPDDPLPQEPPAARPRRGRKGLLAMAAVGTILLGTAGAAGYLYPQDLRSFGLRHLPVPAFLGQGPGLSAQPATEVGVQPGAAPATPARRPAAATAARPQVAEFASLQSLPGSPAAEVGVAVPTPAQAPVTPFDTPVSPSQAAVPAATPPAAHASPSMQLPHAAQPAPAPEPALASAPVVPAAAAAPSVSTPPAPHAAQPASAVLQAAPLSPPEQVRLIDMLKEYGAQLRDTRSKVAQLEDTVAKLQAEVDAKTTSFETRLGLAEVGTVLAQSARAGHPEPSTTGTALPPLRVAATRRAAAPAAAVPSPAVPAARTVKDYRIQGASPGLAVLSALNPLPGGQGAIEVGIGSEVPGVGRVKSIAQRGTAWVVQTDAGAIQ